MKRLEGKTAIITGGSRGIGRAIALLFADHGANVIIYATNPERGQEAIESLKTRAQGDQKFLFKKVDVANHSEVATATDEILEEFGAVDILVNAAGITRDNLLMKMKEDDWDAVIDTNLKSVYNTSFTLIRHMMKRREGKIINISSVIGLTGNAGQVNYSASKSGMIGLTRSLAKEVAARKISINCIAPGFIETDMTDKLGEAQKEAILKQIPMSRMGSAREIANAALFLASGEADYITGQVLTVDGGMTA